VSSEEPAPFVEPRSPPVGAGRGRRLRALAAGFPVAVCRFTGWEDSAALAGQAGDPRRNVPRAVFASIAIMAVSYGVFGYATVTGSGAWGRSGLSTAGGGRQERQAGSAVTWRRHGGVSDPSKTTDTRMVRQ
jgi:amino acid transporter